MADLSELLAVDNALVEGADAPHSVWEEQQHVELCECHGHWKVLLAPHVLLPVSVRLSLRALTHTRLLRLPSVLFLNRRLQV